MYYIEYFIFLLKQEMKTLLKLNKLYEFVKKNTKLILVRFYKKLKREGSYRLVDSNKFLSDIVVLYSKVNRTNTICKPCIFNYNQCLQVLQGEVPDINILEVNDCKVIANTSSIVIGQSIYNNYLTQMKIFHDLKNPLNQIINSIQSKKVSIYVNKKFTIKNSICIHLLNEHSNNYYHLLFEVLPKFILINDFINNDEKYSELDYLLLIDENAPKQFTEIIEYFSSIKHKIEYIPKHSIVNIENLIFCTDFWHSLDNVNFISNIKEDFFVDSFTIETIKKEIKPLTKKPFRKVYFQRKKSQARYLSNTEELEILLKFCGFEFILPETLSFQEQLKLFSESKIIVGISGAVFSNIIFMQENTNAIVFSPNTVASNYYVFQPMADVAKINLIHILTENSFYESVHANSYIDIDIVEKLLIKMNIRKEMLS